MRKTLHTVSGKAALEIICAEQLDQINFKIFGCFFKKDLTFGEVSVIIYRLKELKARATNAGVAELVDARDLKSRDTKVSYGFDSRFRHQSNIAE